ncbi:hypothetical protein P7C73_g3587, partial [Tremellales sp. Uapishka_1]
PLSNPLTGNGSLSRPTSPLATNKSNPFDSPALNGSTPLSPTAGKEKGRWALGRKQSMPPSGGPTLATLQQAVPLPTPASREPENHLPVTVFSTIQTLFHHMSTTVPHQPAPPKTPAAQTNANVTATALANANAITPPSPQTNAPPAGPPLLASLPPPSAPRGGGPFAAGALGRGVVRPEDVLRTVKRENEMFRGASQQDAHEFLGWILNRIAEDVEQVDKDLVAKGKTFVHNLFEGTLTNETRCLSCETVRHCHEHADVRPPPGTSCFSTCRSILSSIRPSRRASVSSPRARCCVKKTNSSAMPAAVCKKQKKGEFGASATLTSRLKIKRLPNVLALHLKRFKYQEDLGRYVKLCYRVPFPTQLRLPNTSDDAEDPDRFGPHHGHYVAIVRSGGRWVMCDDENVEPIDEQDIPRYFGDYPSGAGYVLFYQAVDLDLIGLGLRTPPTPPPAPADVAQAHVSPRLSPKLSISIPAQTPSVPSPAPAQANPKAPLVLTPLSTPLQERSISSTPTVERQLGFAMASPRPEPEKKSKDWFKRSSRQPRLTPNASPSVSRANSGETVTNGKSSTTFTGLGLTVNSSTIGEGIVTSDRSPTMSSSVISTFSASSGTHSNSGTNSSVPPTPQTTSQPQSLPSSNSAGTFMTPQSLPQQSSFGSLGRKASGPNYGGGGSLSRRISGVMGGAGKKLSLTRSGSMAFKGFGKKDKDEEEERKEKDERKGLLG